MDDALIYKVLWVDDEYYDVLEPIVNNAQENGIDSVGVTNVEDALQQLESTEQFDAVILDGLFLDGKDDRSTPSTDLPLAKVMKHVEELKLLRFILSGKTQFTLEQNTTAAIYADGRVFDKSKLEDLQDLWSCIKEAVNALPDFKIKQKYPEPFKCFGAPYLDIQYETSLLNIIKILEDDTIKDVENLLFNPCRMILERVFEKINEVDEKVIPYRLLNFEKQRVGLVNCWKHISGIPYYINQTKQSSSKYLEDSNYAIVSKQVDVIITACHPASHQIQQKYTRYTFQSVLWALFDVLIWLKRFVDEKQ